MGWPATVVECVALIWITWPVLVRAGRKEEVDLLNYLHFVVCPQGTDLNAEVASLPTLSVSGM